MLTLTITLTLNIALTLTLTLLLTLTNPNPNTNPKLLQCIYPWRPVNYTVAYGGINIITDSSTLYLIDFIVSE